MPSFLQRVSPSQNRAHNYPTLKEAKQAELNAIRGILLKNHYTNNQINKHTVPQKQNVYTLVHNNKK
jgi:hypothetical protein